MGAQSFLHAAMEADLGRGAGGKFIKECKERIFLRNEVTDEKVAKKLWEFSDKQIETLEKEGAARRAKEKKDGKVSNEDQEPEKKGSSGESVTPKSNGAKIPGSRRSRKA